MDLKLQSEIINKMDNRDFRETLERLKTTLDKCNIAVWRLCASDNQIVLDEVFHNFLNLPIETSTISVNDFLKNVHVNDRDLLQGAIIHALEMMSEINLQFRICSSNNLIRHFEIQAHSQINIVTNERFINGICFEITERLKNEQLSIESKERKIALDEITDGWWDLDIRTNVLKMSHQFKRKCGYTVEELPDTKSAWESLIYPGDLGLIQNEINECLREKNDCGFVKEIRYIHRDGSYHWGICRAKGLKDKDGKLTTIFGTNTDITKQKLAEKKLSQQALHDSLTGLPNRDYLLQELPVLLSRAKRNKSLVAILFIDLDNFKAINDTLGHQAGDRLLVSVSKKLISSSRSGEFIGRLGGDEFAIAIEGENSIDNFSQVANRFINVLAAVESEGSYRTTFSIGIAIYPDNSESPEGLLKCADIAMYQAKKLGKNQYSFYSEEINKKIQRAYAIERNIITSIENNELYLSYQPKLQVNNKKVVGIEALARWKNTALYNPAPSEFITIAEKRGYIDLIGCYLLEKALDDFRIITAKTKRNDLFLSINISGVQLSSHDSIANIMYKLEQHKIILKSLVFEITETSLMKDIALSKIFLERFTDLGIRCAIDDFGTGYSSLKYLHTLPISFLKIDQSFIKDITINDSSRSIVKSICLLARNLEVFVIAEGVEKQEQYDFLKSCGIEYCQGFYFSKPQSLRGIINYIKDN